MSSRNPIHTFEIYETGDPHSDHWEAIRCSENGTAFYANMPRLSKKGLIRHIRKNFPNDEIRFRSNGRKVRCDSHL